MTSATDQGDAALATDGLDHVMWRICSDLRVLRVQHGMISEEEEDQFAADLLKWLRAGLSSMIEFNFFEGSTLARQFAVRYEFGAASSNGDQESGGLRYRDLTNCLFRVVVYSSGRYAALPDSEREAFRGTLLREWPTDAGVLTDGQGSWAADRTYAGNGVGAQRRVFRPD